MVQLVECVPNFSEGRRPAVIAAITDAAAAVADVTVLDVHTDSAHNRMVLTFVGSPSGALEAAFRAAKRATQLIDLREHCGQHPRIGAADVIPFIPIAGVTMEDCVSLSRELGRRLGEALALPVYLYAEAATRPDRRRLPDVRRGEYEGLSTTISTDPDRTPDFGPSRIGPAGATAVGARHFLVAFNVNLRTSNLRLAREIARSIRESNGGLWSVQARGMATDDPTIVQVSTNLLDTGQTPLHIVFNTICSLAAERGVEIAASEVVGLLPQSVLIATFGHYVSVADFRPEQVLESRLLDALAHPALPPSAAPA